MGRRVIQLRYRPAEGIGPTHLLRAFTAAAEDQERHPGDRDDETVDLQAIAERAGAGALSVVIGSATSHVEEGGDPDRACALVLEFAVLAEDGADPDAVQAAGRGFATAALQRRLGGRSVAEIDDVTLDLDRARIDLTAQGAISPAGSD